MGLAKRCTTIHTTCSLYLAFDSSMCYVNITFGKRIDFFPIVQTLNGVAVGFWISLVIQKSAELFDALERAIPAPHPNRRDEMKKKRELKEGEKIKHQLRSKLGMAKESETGKDYRQGSYVQFETLHLAPVTDVGDTDRNRESRSVSTWTWWGVKDEPSIHQVFVLRPIRDFYLSRTDPTHVSVQAWIFHSRKNTHLGSLSWS